MTAVGFDPVQTGTESGAFAPAYRFNHLLEVRGLLSAAPYKFFFRASSMAEGIVVGS
jgi:hypothetical protein